jgi:protein-disulfide isomerase
MKKAITIGIIILVVLGFGWFLFKISPQDDNQSGQGGDLDLSNIQQLQAPRAVDDSDFILGDKTAKNTFIVYEDFQCPACAGFESTLLQIPGQLKDTKVVYRIFSLPNLHQNALTSAYAALAAGAQGKFWEFSEMLFDKQAEWEGLDDPSGQFADYAQSAGVANLDQFKNDLATKKYKSRLQQDLREALGLNLPGTPSIFFNDQLLQLGDINSIKAQAEKLYKN